MASLPSHAYIIYTLAFYLWYMGMAPGTGLGATVAPAAATAAAAPAGPGALSLGGRSPWWRAQGLIGIHVCVWGWNGQGGTKSLYFSYIYIHSEAPRLSSLITRDAWPSVLQRPLLGVRAPSPSTQGLGSPSPAQTAKPKMCQPGEQEHESLRIYVVSGLATAPACLPPPYRC